MENKIIKAADPRVSIFIEREKLREKVRVYLVDALKGVDPDKTYLNRVNNVIEYVVVHSQSLTDETLQLIEENSDPTYDLGIFGIFTQPYTFDSRLRVQELKVLDYERIVGQLVRSLN